MLPVKNMPSDQTNIQRCWWCGTDPLYVRYHDEEWGRPVTSDHGLFERLSLEGFQAGLSWLTILRKREHFRRAFDGFDMDRVATYGQEKVAALMQDAGIIRHRGKIEAVIQNAACAQKLREEFGDLKTYFYGFTPVQPEAYAYDEASIRERTVDAQSHALSKDLKKRGFKFVGPTTMYALMQAIGIVNDHVEHCHVRGVVEELRAAHFARKA